MELIQTSNEEYEYDYNCDPCKGAGDYAEAEGFCNDCKEYLCRMCFRCHSRNKVSKHHILLNKDNMPRKSQKLCDPCKIVGDEISAVGYCEDCCDSLCSDCFKSHSRNKFSRHHVLMENEKVIKNVDHAASTSIPKMNIDTDITNKERHTKGKGNSAGIMIGSSIDQQGAVSAAISTEITAPPEEVNSDMVSGAKAAQNTNLIELEEEEQREVDEDETIIKEPISTSAHMQKNGKYSKKEGQNAQGKTVDFAPEFSNQLVATAVNSAGQAYITAKAVFKTWQEKQEAKLQQQRQQQQQQMKAGEPKTQLKGCKLDSTQYTPTKEGEFELPKSEWTPPKSDYKPPSMIKGLRQIKTKKPGPKIKPPVESEPAPPKDQWKSSTDGPLTRLYEMGFFDTELNKRLLVKHKDDLEKVIQELLSMKNKDWFVKE